MNDPVDFERLGDLSRMPLGKAHFGVAMEKVPASYLLWYWDDAGLWEEAACCRSPAKLAVRDYIKRNFDELEEECPDRIVEHRP